jgi:hypothetical protein
MPTMKKPRGRVPVFHTLLVFRCETTLSEALAEEAARLGTSISDVIRTLLVAGLKEA